MKKIISKAFIVGIFVFLGVFIFKSNIDAAYTNKVVKSYKYDFNPILDINTNFHDYKYIYVADDARLYNQIERQHSYGWNYVGYEVINYYKNADMNW